MILEIKDIYVIQKKTFKANNQCYVIDYIYVDKKGDLVINHAYIDEKSYNSINTLCNIDKNGTLTVNGCVQFRGHYTNYKFVADEIVERV